MAKGIFSPDVHLNAMKRFSVFLFLTMSSGAYAHQPSARFHDTRFVGQVITINDADMDVRIGPTSYRLLGSFLVEDSDRRLGVYRIKVGQGRAHLLVPLTDLEPGHGPLRVADAVFLSGGVASNYTCGADSVTGDGRGKTVNALGQKFYAVTRQPNLYSLRGITAGWRVLLAERRFQPLLAVRVSCLWRDEPE